MWTSRLFDYVDALALPDTVSRVVQLSTYGFYLLIHNSSCCNSEEGWLLLFASET
jgi:hypothetical protein